MTHRREDSESGYWHVIMRGVGRMVTFYDEIDFEYFKSLMQRYGEKLGISVIAYAMLSNHVHMIVRKDSDKDIGDFIKRICISYTQYHFNIKYKRCGSLFQSRFVSRPISDDGDLSTVVRYIAYNPTKAGLGNPEEYVYSSYADLLGDYAANKNTSFTDSGIIRSILPNVEALAAFMAKHDIYLPEKEDYSLDDTAAAAEMAKAALILRERIEASGIRQTDDDFCGEKVRKIIAYLAYNHVSMARMSRLSGIPMKIIAFYSRC